MDTIGAQIFLEGFSRATKHSCRGIKIKIIDPSTLELTVKENKLSLTWIKESEDTIRLEFDSHNSKKYEPLLENFMMAIASFIICEINVVVRKVIIPSKNKNHLHYLLTHYQSVDIQPSHNDGLFQRFKNGVEYKKRNFGNPNEFLTKNKDLKKRIEFLEFDTVFVTIPLPVNIDIISDDFDNEFQRVDCK